MSLTNEKLEGMPIPKFPTASRQSPTHQQKKKAHNQKKRQPNYRWEGTDPVRVSSFFRPAAKVTSSTASLHRAPYHVGPRSHRFPRTGPHYHHLALSGSLTLLPKPTPPGKLTPVRPAALLLPTFHRPGAPHCLFSEPRGC